jgi:hypothetical protein
VVIPTLCVGKCVHIEVARFNASGGGNVETRSKHSESEGKSRGGGS